MIIDRAPHVIIEIFPEVPEVSKMPEMPEVQKTLAEKVEDAVSAFHFYQSRKPETVVVEVASPRPPAKLPQSPSIAFDDEIFLPEESGIFECVIS